MFPIFAQVLDPLQVAAQALAADGDNGASNLWLQLAVTSPGLLVLALKLWWDHRYRMKSLEKGGAP